MTLKEKLNQKLDSLDKLETELDVWIEIYQSGASFPANPEWNSNSYKLKTIKKIITKMIEVAEHAELLEELIEEVEKW